MSRRVNGSLCGAWWVLFVLVASAPAPGAQPYGLPGPRQPVTPYLGMPQTPPLPSGAWTTELAFPNLTFQNPVFLAQAPRSNRLYVCEREGRLYSFQNDPGTSGKTLVLDLTAHTQGWDDCGLMSMAFHPQFGLAGSANRGYFYVYHQYSDNPVPGPNRPPNTTPTFERIARYTIPDGQFTADPASELVLVNQHDRNIWHDGGCLLFNPADGFLYFTIGDEGDANDSYNVTQRINDKLFGGVFRIDVDMRGGAVSHPIRRQPQSYSGRPSMTANYYIPNDNPFLDTGGGVLEEFYALGARSPHRLTYDAGRNILLLGDVGQGAWEEVDIVEKGKNYQWPYREGNHTGPKAKPSPLIGVDAPPIYEYPHAGGTFEGNCIIGGYVYHGAEHAAALGGKYLFGDNTYGRLWSLDLATTPPSVAYLTNMPSGTNYTGLSSFGVDASGELYLLKMNHTGPGQIYKLGREGTSGAPFPARLSQTGAFTAVATLDVASGLIPYDVGSPLWSDGAHKLRWLALPYAGGAPTAAELIQFSPTGEWQFPAGTVFVKHFELTVNEITGARRRLETRLLVRSPGTGVYGVTYKWRPDETEADLLTDGLDEDIAIVTPSGTVNHTWRYPSATQCLTCHNAAAQHVLGVKTRQLNNDVQYIDSGVIDNQLRALNHLGLFQPAIVETAIPGYAQLVPVDDPSAGLELRVRSYIDANCALCHRPGNVQAFFDARFDTPLDQQGLINGPVANSLGIDGEAVIRPRDVWRSVLHVRDSSTGAIRMPPLARNVPDDAALSTIEDWINSLPGTPALPPPTILPEDPGFQASVEVSIVDSDPAATIRYTLDGTDPTAASPAYGGPFILTDSRMVSARAFRTGFATSVLARTQFVSALSGLEGEYFDNPDLTVSRVIRVDPTVDFDWGQGSPDPAIGPDTFSARWTGEVEALYSETYTFYTMSDDGIRLWIEDLPVIDNWTDHAPTEDSGTMALQAGQRYSIRLEFYENGVGAVARLLWSSPSTPKQVIPQVRLFSGSQPSNPDIDGLTCVKQGTDGSLRWSNRGTYQAVRVYQNGALARTLAGTATTALLPLDGTRTINIFRVASVASGAERGGQTCSVLSITGTYTAVIDEHFSPIPPATRLKLNCDAAVRNGALELTEPLEYLAGSAFFLAAQPDDEFIAEFDFTFPEATNPGADGLAFIANTGGSTAICGAAGGALGFRDADDGASVYPGFAVLFDTWQNPGEVSHNWVGFVDFQKGGAAQAAANVPEEFCNDGTFHATIVASQGVFAVLLENTGLGMAQRQVLSYAMDGFAPQNAFFGFSAGTGGAWARHTVDNFRLRIPGSAPPTAAFSGTPLSGTAPLTVKFTSASTGQIDTYAWTFGDGTTGNQASPTHIYQSIGSYTVTLQVTGPGGQDSDTKNGYVNVNPPPPVAAFSATPRSGAAPLSVKFTNTSTGSVESSSWIFGDGTTSTTTSPTHIYQATGSYNVTLQVTGPGGQDSEVKLDYVIVNPPAPVAAFSGTPLSGAAPLSVKFSSTSTGQIDTHAWNFGDGGTSAQVSPTHVYQAAGTFNVTLQVTGQGGQDSEVKTGYVIVSPPAPVAAFSAAPASGIAPLSVNFTSTSTGQISTYAWNFGDGGTSTQVSPTHIYQAAGTFTVSLQVTGPGGQDTETLTNLISVSQGEGSFARGDANGDNRFDISDGVFIILYAFTGGATTNCPDALDTDDSGDVDVTDVLRILNYMFLNGARPEAPFPAAGVDPTADDLAVCRRGL